MAVLVAQKLNPEAHTLLFLLSVVAIVPLAGAESTAGADLTRKLSVGLALLLIAIYGLGMMFSGPIASSLAALNMERTARLPGRLPWH